MSLILLSTLLGLATVQPSLPNQHLNVCPVRSDAGHRIAEEFASSQEYTRTRRRAGLPRIDSEDIRSLSDPRDTKICKRLHQFVQTHHGTAGTIPSFYEARGYYFVIMGAEGNPMAAPSGHINTRWTSLYVLNHKSNVVARIVE